MTRAIVVTGASRGIGRALAVALAGPGVHLGLVGRDAALLHGTATACRSKGATAEPLLADVRAREELARMLLAFDDAHPVELAIANAGVALPAGDLDVLGPSSYGEIDVNVLGALNTVLPLLPRMVARGAGQVALTSSLAAFAPLPDSPGYSGSKAAVLVYGLALRQRLRASGVRVSVICPGYVETDMGARYQGWRPLLMSSDEAARRIVRGLARDRAVIAFPAALAWAARLSTLVPEPVMRIGLSAFRFRIGRAAGTG